MKKIVFHEEYCMGCHLCEVHCIVQHSKYDDIVKAFKKETPSLVSRVTIEEDKPTFLSVKCQHCNEPVCTYYCITGALHKEPGSGVIMLDEEKCIGCWTCLLACPFGAVNRDENRKKAVKCDLCNGDETPACVLHCPNEALECIQS